MKEDALNYSEFLEAFTEPLYEKEGEAPKCPPGYRWDIKTMQCVPKGKKDNVSGPGGKSPYGNYAYNIIGSSGYDGGWAFEEPPTSGGDGGAG